VLCEALLKRSEHLRAEQDITGKVRFVTHQSAGQVAATTVW
jgi:hypothetical protein